MLSSLCFSQLESSESKLLTWGFGFWKGHVTTELFRSNTVSKGGMRSKFICFLKFLLKFQSTYSVVLALGLSLKRERGKYLHDVRSRTMCHKTSILNPDYTLKIQACPPAQILIHLFWGGASASALFPKVPRRFGCMVRVGTFDCVAHGS